MSVTYSDIKSDILSKIMKGSWGPGSLIPTEIELADSYGCARATVNRAMRELSDEGMIERRRKAGTRVRMAPVRQATFDIPIVRKEIEARGAQYRYSLVKSGIEIAPEWLRARLNLNDDDKVLRLICLHFENGTPYQHEDRWINLAVLSQAETADFSKVGPNEWLVETVPFSSAEISFCAAEATAAQAKHLGCNKGDALFLTERSTWWEGQAITYVQLTFRHGHRMTTTY